MRAELLRLSHEIRSSYWFVPTCMLFGAIILAVGVRWLGTSDSLSWLEEFHWFSDIRPAGARSVLTTIAGSVIGVAGVTFSITMVAVSFASSNYGPRLIGNFMRDRGNQFTLGVFIGTFVYCLLVLPAIRAGSEAYELAPFIPTAAIPMALILALASIAVLIYFIHHVTESINIENIVAAIGQRLNDDVRSVFPFDKEDRDVESPPDGPSALPLHPDDTVKAIIGGYVQALDIESLNNWATDKDVHLRVHYRPGDFVVPGDDLASVYGQLSLDDDARKALCDCFATGNQRTETQNILYGFSQLIEVIARALSPGVNDPFTAITCFNWLKAPLRTLLNLQKSGHGLVRCGRVNLLTIDARQVLDEVFLVSLPYVASDRTVSLAVMSILAELAESVHDSDCAHLLIPHMDALAEAGAAALDNPVSRRELAQRHSEAVAVATRTIHPDTLRREASWFGGGA